MDLNTATFEEMQSLAGIGHDRAQAIFDGEPISADQNFSRCGERLG